MQLEGDDLLAQFREDWPQEYELSRLRLLCRLQQAEIDRLTSREPPPPSFTVPGRTFGLDEEVRHG